VYIYIYTYIYIYVYIYTHTHTHPYILLAPFVLRLGVAPVTGVVLPINDLVLRFLSSREKQG